DKDTPTAPITGTASFRRFRLEACFGIAEASNAFHGRRRLSSPAIFVRFGTAPGNSEDAGWRALSQRGIGATVPRPQWLPNLAKKAAKSLRFPPRRMIHERGCGSVIPL